MCMCCFCFCLLCSWFFYFVFTFCFATFCINFRFNSLNKSFDSTTVRLHGQRSVVFETIYLISSISRNFIPSQFKYFILSLISLSLLYFVSCSLLLVRILSLAIIFAPFDSILGSCPCFVLQIFNTYIYI